MLDNSNMFAHVQCPETLRAEELDSLLEQGWFRMGQTIFTTNFLNFKNEFYSAVWLRISLDEFSRDSQQEKIFTRTKAFSVQIKKALITPEKEALYTIYKQSVPFQPSASLHALLYGKTNSDIYQTHEITIYDKSKLIAAGFFDIGKNSAAGITSFYDPAYKKYSLGKHLIYLKIDYCKKLGLQFFYPGYFVPGYSLFDYKLEIGKNALYFLELTSGRWNPIAIFSAALNPLQVMRDRLHALQMLLHEYKIETKLLKYEFFDANLIPELSGIELFDFPLFLNCFGLGDENLHPVVYDIRDHQYYWIKCRSVWSSNSGTIQDEIYSSNVLKLEQCLFVTEGPEAMTKILVNEVKSNVSTLREK